MSNKVEIFRNILNEFETEEYRLFCEDLLEKSPDYNYQIPSSTSLKYHNKTQCQPGGQILHVIMAASILNYLLGLDYIKEKFSNPVQRDCMRVAICLHDVAKCGLENPGKYTVHEHPMLGSEFVITTPVKHDVEPKYRKYIGRLIQSHSGQWTSNNRSNVILPKPENDAQFMIHLADYLASRSNIDMIYDDRTLDILKEFAGPQNIKLNFGKYTGKTVKEVEAIDKQYLKWCIDTLDLNEPLRSTIESVVR